jgi:hypothetical protein
MPFMNPMEVADRSPWRLTIERGDKSIGKRTVEKFIWRDVVELYDLETDPDRRSMRAEGSPALRALIAGRAAPAR